MNKISLYISTATGIYGVATIQSILGIVITILSALNILWQFGVSVYKHFKEKKYEEISNDINNAKEQLEGLSDKNKN